MHILLCALLVKNQTKNIIKRTNMKVFNSFSTKVTNLKFRLKWDFTYNLGTNRVIYILLKIN